MTEKEILDELGRIEVRTGAERTIKSYVLRSNTLDEGQRRLVCDQYENYCVGFHDGFIDPHSLFKDPSKEVIVEIGFGMGTSTQVIAQERDGYNYLCLEVYLQGFVKLLRDVSAKGLENIKLMRFNAVDVLERMIPPFVHRRLPHLLPRPLAEEEAPQEAPDPERLRTPPGHQARQGRLHLLRHRLGGICPVDDGSALWRRAVGEPLWRLLSSRSLATHDKVREEGPGQGLRDQRTVVHPHLNR